MVRKPTCIERNQLPNMENQIQNMEGGERERGRAFASYLYQISKAALTKFHPLKNKTNILKTRRVKLNLLTETSIARHNNTPSASSSCHWSHMRPFPPLLVYPLERERFTYFVRLLSVLGAYRKLGQLQSSGREWIRSESAAKRNPQERIIMIETKTLHIYITEKINY